MTRSPAALVTLVDTVPALANSAWFVARMGVFWLTPVNDIDPPTTFPLNGRVTLMVEVPLGGATSAQISTVSARNVSSMTCRVRACPAYVTEVADTPPRVFDTPTTRSRSEPLPTVCAQLRGRPPPPP